MYLIIKYFIRMFFKMGQQKAADASRTSGSNVLSYSEFYILYVHFTQTLGKAFQSFLYSLTVLAPWR